MSNLILLKFAQISPSQQSSQFSDNYPFPPHSKHIFSNLYHLTDRLIQNIQFEEFYQMLKRIIKPQKLTEQAKQQKNPPVASPKYLQQSNLKNIIEVTQQNQPNPIVAKTCTTQDQIPVGEKQTGCFAKFTKCLSDLWRNFFFQTQNYTIDLDSDDFVSIIYKIRSKKYESKPLLPPSKENKRVLVLDLDQTLIHTTFTKPLKYDFQTDVVFNDKNTKIYTVKRFGLDAFLFEMSQLYEIVIFTASQRIYADKVIDLIDPKKRATHRLYREHCVAVNKTYFLKNIQALGRKVKDVIIVDDNNIAGLLQPQNFYKINPFEGSEKDRQLCRLSAFLKHLHEKRKIQSIRAERKEFEEMEINLSQSDISSAKSSINQRSLLHKKRQYQHKKTTSEIESLVTKSTEDDNESETTATEIIKRL